MTETEPEGPFVNLTSDFRRLPELSLWQQFRQWLSGRIYGEWTLEPAPDEDGHVSIYIPPAAALRRDDAVESYLPPEPR